MRVTPPSTLGRNEKAFIPRGTLFTSSLKTALETPPGLMSMANMDSFRQQSLAICIVKPFCSMGDKSRFIILGKNEVK